MLLLHKLDMDVPQGGPSLNSTTFAIQTS